MTFSFFLLVPAPFAPAPRPLAGSASARALIRGPGLMSAGTVAFATR
ncbi:hypothetical protein SJ05684_c18040 [Sinorhizobium sojae CCBAU 05684]|uniref:Uncharacterized protein n=1 Tax=Sinorhizobium sojae CCBAU 05684 TaxID=716928 RepID=A0A249PBN7_9HYPH|nr:hypothetical protein SJ05684_c18040 [Sinorhizobium sojae CCBAU 05684]